MLRSFSLRCIALLAAGYFAGGCALFTPPPHTAATSQPSAKPWSALAVQLASRQPVESWTPMTDASGHTVYVAPEILLSERDLLAARALHARDGHVVELEFTSAAAMKLAEITGRNVGASLAFVVEGQLVSAPVVASRIDNGIAYLSANYSAKEADDVARRIREPDPVPVTAAPVKTPAKKPSGGR